MTGLFSASIYVNFKDSFFGWITSVHGPSKYKGRDDFWQEILDLNGLCAGHWCIGRDFNVVRRIEKKSTRGRFTRSMKNFNLLIEDLNFIDVPMKNDSFTWSDFRERPVATSIDRFLLSQKCVEAFKEVELLRLHRTTSDHSPLFLKLGNQKWGPLPLPF